MNENKRCVGEEKRGLMGFLDRVECVVSDYSFAPVRGATLGDYLTS